MPFSTAAGPAAIGLLLLKRGVVAPLLAVGASGVIGARPARRSHNQDPSGSTHAHLNDWAREVV